jgi:hypothetical protein
VSKRTRPPNGFLGTAKPPLQTPRLSKKAKKVTPAPSHPYVQFEGTPLWRVIDRAVAGLERNTDLTLTTAREYVIGYLCRQVSRLRMPRAK